MNNEVSIIITLSAIIFISPYLSKFFRIPTTPIEIVLGSIAATVGTISYNHLFELIAEVGFFYLMFLAGTEVKLKELLGIPRSLLKRDILYILLLYLFSSLFVLFHSYDTLFIFILPLISVGLVLTLFKEFGKDAKWLNLSMQTGIMGELVSIVAVTIVGSVLVHGFGTELYLSIGYLLLFLLTIAIIFKGFRILFWWYPELKNYLIPKYADKDEKDIRLSMALFFLMIAIMIILDIEVAFGAFIAGVFIPTFFDHHKELPHKLSSFGFGFLIPLFFVYIGSTLKLDEIFEYRLIIEAIWITVAMIGIRVLSSVAFLGVLSFKERVLFAFSHSMPLTLLIAIVTLAYQNESIGEFYYRAFVLAGLFEVIISIVAIKLLGKSNIEDSRKAS